MNQAIDGTVRVERNGRTYLASYKVLGGVVTVDSGLGPAEELEIGKHDTEMPLDELARKVLNRHIDEYAARDDKR